MIRKFAFAALGVAVAFGSMTGVAQAQSAERVYDNGSVWNVSFIETKPGMFDEYMAYLNGPWRSIQEAGKKDGDVLSYRILAIGAPRDHEPNLVLMVEYKNMAVFDRSLAETDRQTAGVFGSAQKAVQSQISREAMRSARGGFQARELKFMK